MRTNKYLEHLNSLFSKADDKKPGLWENIRRKKEREGKNYKPAKTVKEGRPTQEQLKRAQSEPTEKQKEALDKNKDGKITKEDFELLRKGKSEESTQSKKEVCCCSSYLPVV